MHPYREAIEGGLDLGKLATVLADDVVIYSPVLLKPISGKARYLKIIEAAIGFTGTPKDIIEFHDGRKTMLTWQGTIQGHDLDIAFLLTDNEEGKVESLRKLMRPWPVVEIFRNAMREHFRPTSALTEEYWSIIAA
jgi:hypothetical protein